MSNLITFSKSRYVIMYINGIIVIIIYAYKIWYDLDIGRYVIKSQLFIMF